MDSTKNSVITRFDHGAMVEAEDTLINETPLAIEVQSKPFAVLMRTPGDDRALTVGFCFTEGLLESFDDVESIELVEKSGAVTSEITLVPEAVERCADLLSRAPFLSRSGCGVCGKKALSDLAVNLTPVRRENRISSEFLITASEKMIAGQQLFPKTGAAHAAALFDREGNIIAMAEDIGRHNALDEAIGAALISGGIDRTELVFTSSRCSYEIISKAARTGALALATVSAPTAMAVELAMALNITLVGFMRGAKFNIYTRADRIKP